MAEVRFKIKGQEQEIVFSPIIGEDGNMYLYAKLPNADERKIPCRRSMNMRIWKDNMQSLCGRYTA